MTSLADPLTLGGRAPGEIPLLATLQANVLRPHVRTRMHVLHLQVRAGREADARTVLARVAADVKPAAQHLAEVASFRRDGTSGTAFVSLGLSASGYERLGIEASRRPSDPAFDAGLAGRGPLLNDPPQADWDEGYRARADAIVLVGGADEAMARAAVVRVQHTIGDVLRVVARELGSGQSNAAGRGIEHFGYVDGRSQPVFIAEDLDREGDQHWKPLVPLDRVLVPDPGMPQRDDCFGSFLVYRKLEQDTLAFEQRRQAVAAALGHADPDRAGALLVGRFEDGTPVVLQPEDGLDAPNDFGYAEDADGARCPVTAHVRRMNPRRGGVFDGPVLARRGQTFGTRPGWRGGQGGPHPSTGVGLLFVALMADIESQFEALQRAANGVDGPLDPLIAQGPRAAVELPATWGQPEPTVSVEVPQTVRLLGGEYFFLPSLPFLRSLA